jgi:CRISPR/Cas system-associated exonuclease Cas4 (RecB family)
MTEKELELRFNQGLFEDHVPSGKISVSSIIYPCLRKAYYEKKHGAFFDISAAYTFWIGKAMHKMNFLEEGEGELEWEGIVGRFDDYEKGTLVDKKSVNELPRTANSHHITQLEYYYVLCQKNHKPVNDIWILYLEKKYPAHKWFKVKPRPLEVIEKEMLERKSVLEECLAKGSNKIPGRDISWLCKYCPFTPLCFGKNKEMKENG